MTLGEMIWKRMKMKRMSLKVNSKWYGDLGKESWEGSRVVKCVK
jgi:hypothetical protein